MSPTRNPILRRFAAAAIDWSLVALWAGGLFLVASKHTSHWFQSSAASAELSGFLALTLPLGIYLVFSEAVYGATLGKKLLHLSVSASYADRPTLSQVCLRNILKLTPWELAHFSIWHSFVFPHNTLAAAGYFTLICSYLLAGIYLYGLCRSNGRPLYDVLAGTEVTFHPRILPSKPS